MEYDLIWEHRGLFLEGVWTTIWLIGSSLLIGAVLAIPLALFQAYKIPYLGRAAATYSYAFRGTPLLVQLYLLYYGVSQFEAVRESIFWVALKRPEICAVLAFSLNSAAYVCEMIRGAILAIPQGEIEAAQAIGMTRAKVTRRIIIPSALRRALPAYSNEVIFLLHASVIASTITITDILGAGRTLNGMYYLAYEGLLVAAVLYLAIVFLVDRVFKQAERRYLAYLVR
ncbi:MULTISPECIES: ABC transporter permease [unclassified Shimia]|uniref:ABC transporter permease n=1 Tax=unclassified Shimia TaxID=2630038 RepID=UPI001ADC3C4E|nr:ABC transporter permease subunit [Shimia sp. R9_2]MBO9398787.1 ABC transporter permease subunit [Shimia sp. R9_2]